jgi:hypothetical protein
LCCNMLGLDLMLTTLMLSLPAFMEIELGVRTNVKGHYGRVPRERNEHGVKFPKA